MSIAAGAGSTGAGSFDEYIVGLARQVVQNVEAGTWSLEEALTRTRRLAGACGHSDYERWLGYELAGFPSDVDPDVAALLKRANLPDVKERRTYFSSSLIALSAGLGKLAHATAFNRRQLNTVIGRRSTFTGTDLQKSELADWDKQEKDARHFEGLRLQLVQSVLFEVLRYAGEVLHRYAYWDTSLRLFERQRTAVDRLLKEQAPNVLEKLPAVFERLRLEQGDAIMQAMVTMRSLFVALADRLYPPTEPIQVDGKEVKLGPEEVMNRLQQLLRARCQSEKRRDRLIRSTRDLWGRVASGTHTDMSPHEAQSVVLQCLLVVGEILNATA